MAFCNQKMEIKNNKRKTLTLNYYIFNIKVKKISIFFRKKCFFVSHFCADMKGGKTTLKTELNK